MTNFYESYVTGNEEEGYKLLNTISIDCGEICEDLTLQLEAQESLTGTFEHEDGGKIKLVDYSNE